MPSIKQKFRQAMAGVILRHTLRLLASLAVCKEFVGLVALNVNIITWYGIAMGSLEVPMSFFWFNKIVPVQFVYSPHRVEDWPWIIIMSPGKFGGFYALNAMPR